MYPPTTSTMRIDRIEPSRRRKDRVLVFLEGGDLLRVTEQELQRRGIPQELWDDALALLPEGEEAIERFIRSTCKGKPRDRETQRKLAAALQRRGFSWQEIRPVLNRLGEEMAEE